MDNIYLDAIQALGAIQFLNSIEVSRREARKQIDHFYLQIEKLGFQAYDSLTGGKRFRLEYRDKKFGNLIILHFDTEIDLVTKVAELVSKDQGGE